MLVPLGRPIANTQVYALDVKGGPAPVAVAGELHIGGAGLARCYSNRPEATAERFIPNPFGHQPGARLYRTGDLGRQAGDGNLEFLGRVDDQVKIRGFRIEPAEVRAALCQHPAVRDAAVVAREDAANDRRLVAYVVADPQQAVTSDGLRRFMRERLPDYMLPSAFVMLQRLPITANGKLDRAALPAPDATRPELEVAYFAAGSELEEAIAEIWREALQVDRVGLYDNFFDLGGHSLSMILVHSKVLELARRDVSLIDLFKYPTVKSLAGYLTQGKHESYIQSGSSRAGTRKASMKRQRQIRQAR